MSKVEIVGEKALLEGTVSALRNIGLFHVEPATVGFIEGGLEEHIRSFSPDEKTLLERLFLEDLRLKIEELFSCIPKMEFRKSYIEPLSIIDVISKTVPKHLAGLKSLCEKRDELRKEKSDLGRYEIFLGTLSSLIKSSAEAPDLDFIGLTIRDPTMVGRLRDAISRITDWKFDLSTETAEDGTLVGLITVEKEMSDRVKQSLSDEHVPELKFPSSFSELPFAGKVAYVRKRIEEISAELRAVDSQLEHFALRWMPIYQRVREWIEDRLSILRAKAATASAYETRMCFFIHGWIPSRKVKTVRERLHDEFGSRVILDEKEIREEDMERVPIILQNSPYFKPFELFTRLLPLPAYTSYDPTPFIGIFFPIFFGMILGDAGYGIVLVAAAVLMMRKYK
ncbi:MAG: V-type ATPase 116kDa subunit family protein, partial [Thermodesulfovibrionales bacterium]